MGCTDAMTCDGVCEWVCDLQLGVRMGLQLLRLGAKGCCDLRFGAK